MLEQDGPDVRPLEEVTGSANGRLLGEVTEMDRMLLEEVTEIDGRPLEEVRRLLGEVTEIDRMLLVGEVTEIDGMPLEEVRMLLGEVTVVGDEMLLQNSMGGVAQVSNYDISWSKSTLF